MVQPDVSNNDISMAMELSEFMATSFQESWKSMVSSKDDATMPPKISETYNPNEAYLQLMFCRTACRLARCGLCPENMFLTSPRNGATQRHT